MVLFHVLSAGVLLCWVIRLPNSAVIAQSGSSALEPFDFGPVVETPPVTYGNLTCEPYYAGGDCQPILGLYPSVVTNFSRSDQIYAKRVVDRIILTLYEFRASDECIHNAIPLLCRYSFPTCDPAYNIPVYQPVCQRDCEIVRDFLCKEPWQRMVQLINILNLSVIDQPNCGPLKYVNAGAAPMCISTLDGGAVPLPLNTGPTCYSGRGRGYNGTLNVTASGYLCQSWNSSFPHQHLLHLGDYPELEGGHNFCRNPGERGKKPWCFTTNRDRRWEYCNVPPCPNGPMCMIYTQQVCRTHGSIGMDQIYTDTTVGSRSAYNASITSLFTTAQTFEPQCRNIFEEFVCIANFPSCDMSYPTPRPMQVCRSYCELMKSVCTNDLETLENFNPLLNIGPIVIPNCSLLPDPNGGQAPECYLPTTTPDFQNYGTTTCYNASNKGETYHGNHSTTESGTTCQQWSSQAPHIHPITPLFRRYLEGHNYCRNPEGRGSRPWCYTTDPSTRWQYCNIPVCTPEEPVDSNETYLVIALPTVAGVLLITILVVILIIICYCSHKVSHKKNLPKEVDGERYSHGPVHIVSMHSPNMKESANPLYARNPLVHQGPVEYDGVKLPEYPRDSIFYIGDLGQGQFGVVVQAEATNIIPGVEKSMVAIKVLKEGASMQVKREFFREATLMHTFDHPNIVKLLGVCIDQEPLCMIFEFMKLGDLNNFLRQNAPEKWGSHPSLTRSGHFQPRQAGLSIQQLVDICINIAAGLEYLAQNHFVHRDMATRNCLVDSNLLVKISDFGLSQDVYSTDYFRLGDSELLPIRWMPPESIMYAKFTVQSDIWSFGVVLWEVFSFGIQPYYSLSNEEVVQHVRDGNVMTRPEGCPQEIYDLMLDCWAMSSEDRPTAGEIHSGLMRWSPDLSASLQQQQQQVKHTNYQNMATIREYALHTSTRSEGGPFITDMSIDETMYPLQALNEKKTSEQTPNSSNNVRLSAPASRDGTLSPLQPLGISDTPLNSSNDALLSPPTSHNGTISPLQPLGEQQASETPLNNSKDALLSPATSPDPPQPTSQHVNTAHSPIVTPPTSNQSTYPATGSSILEQKNYPGTIPNIYEHSV